MFGAQGIHQNICIDETQDYFETLRFICSYTFILKKMCPVFLFYYQLVQILKKWSYVKLMNKRREN